MLMVVCDVCGEEVLRVDAVGIEHGARLRSHLRRHQLGVETFAAVDVLRSFSVHTDREHRAVRPREQ